MPFVAVTLAALGGCASTSELRRQHTKRQLRRALDEGTIARPDRGRYVLADITEHRRIAHARAGILSHTSAALEHGWKVKIPPTLAQVTFPRTRHLRKETVAALTPHWSDLPPEDVVRGVTTPLRTVLDCARHLPFDEALAVADAALRSHKVGVAQLAAAAAKVRGPGAGSVRRVVAHADARATNPLESVLRALSIEEGFTLTPQLMIAESGLFAVVDLGDPDLRLVLEAEGYATHGTRAGLRRDCRRHSELAVFGWDSLRYAYEDVMFNQPWVRWTLRSWRETREGRIPPPPPRGSERAA
ncbi:MAG: hypothetical protein IPM00_18770 [Tetrasphaera sp.]|nr:hypothetical protein [Tetrasphaera sp.]